MCVRVIQSKCVLIADRKEVNFTETRSSKNVGHDFAYLANKEVV